MSTEPSEAVIISDVHLPKTVLPEKVKPTIYLAGKALGRKWEIVKPFEGIIHFTASDGNNHSAHSFGAQFEDYDLYSDDLQKEFVYSYCLSSIVSCQQLIAYLDTADSFGSIAEIAWASAYGKPCTLIILDKWREEMHDAYWFVSCFPNVKSVVVINEEEAIKAVAKVAHSAAYMALIGSIEAKLDSPLEKTFLDCLIETAETVRPSYSNDSAYLDIEHNGVHFLAIAQAVVEVPKRYRLDFLFYTDGLKLAVEIDGHDFHEKTKEQAQRDKSRDRALTGAGFTVLRYTGSEIYRDAHSAVSEVLSFITGKK
jgi:very-short-patch-repair endonuclease/nucleoside 2-deoxyribosyltransferase